MIPLEELQDVVGADFVTADPDHMQSYLMDETAQAVKPRPAEHVTLVKPANAKQVSAVLRLANRYTTAVFARGGGTSTVGGSIPSRGGLIVSLERLNRIEEVDRDNLMVVAQAGVPLADLLRALEGVGLLFPPHPGDEGAQVGGVVACNAGGSRAVKYGVVRNYVKGLEVVLPTGDILTMGGKLLKNNTGLDLLHLMVGSEGVLGIITKAIFRVYPMFEHTAVLLISFSSRHVALSAVPRILQGGVVPLAIEYVERDIIEISARALGLTWPAATGDAHLIVTLAGPAENQVYAECESVAHICERNGAVDVLIADTRQEQESILKMRNELYGALMPQLAEALDLAVPPARIADFLDAVDRVAQRFNTRIPCYGHAADGNLHPHLMMDLYERGVLGEVRDAVYEEGARLGGVVTAEHGVGRTRLSYYNLYTDETSKGLMRGIKRLFDPYNILNPDATI